MEEDVFVRIYRLKCLVIKWHVCNLLSNGLEKKYMCLWR